uniref:Wbp11/ELF5/Saf1 N-terminal domain-containing protein n=1 Tax=Gorilla gorilla gorilla TaxID=9595 RepID=A0A2I2ZAQ9_GORGO
MGRRSASSTKSGKFMNPTDQAGKEARNRELKNKKQLMMVRAAVLKMKDPKQMIRDMEILDEMEFNPVQQPQLNEKVLKDKRKNSCKELRKLEIEYEQKRTQPIFEFLKLPSEVMMMMFLAPVKMMASLRTWIKISMMTVLMTVTPTDQIEKVCAMMMVAETTMKKRSQV